ncbi:MAG: flavodoxin-dependent (E)-4-hydroxy-3-methylbut-2-enyl-diphosphate synthase [Clostridiales bacterium]|nr:flavodoxin-dependent (E)-4-hydroxy-3-methylbut-2-enyl-diphosphate synthase [Clostridiales bacterium]
MAKEVKIGNITIGGGKPIAVQSMTNTVTSDYDATFLQLQRLQEAGCDIARLAVNNNEDVEVSKRLIKKIDMPLVADIQFDYKLAVMSADAGYAKIRFNPGNIGSKKNVAEVVSACKQNCVPIRIGVNSGSLEKEISKTYGFGADAMIKSVQRHVEILEKFGFYDIVLSAKSSDVKTTVEVYRKLYLMGYPLHVGVTESGYSTMGMIKSSIGVGSLLLDGIGDTIRVSLTGDPIQEVEVAQNILKAIGLKEDFCEIVSCPTCSRCKYDLESIVKELTEYTKNTKKKIKIAAMGCIVNGPGEARDADFGFAGGGNGQAVIFEKGNVVKKIATDEILSEIKRRIDNF